MTTATRWTDTDVSAISRDRPIRIAVVTNMWPHEVRPTFGVFVRDQVRSLQALPGVEVEVFPLQPIEQRSRYLRGGEISRTIIRAGFDIVHCHHPFALAALAPYPVVRRRPVILTIHGIEGTEGWRRHLTSSVARLADAVVVTNAELHRRYGGHLIPCGVDPGRFAREGAHRSAGDPVVVLTVGEDRPEKQFWLARQAVAWAASSKSMAGIQPVAFHHRFVTGVHPDDMPEVYRKADILVLSSRAEGSPMVIQEALASRLRVVSTDVGDIRLLEGSDRGVYVAARQTVESLGAALADALRDESEGRSFVTSFVRQEDTASRLVELYRLIAGNRGRVKFRATR